MSIATLSYTQLHGYKETSLAKNIDKQITADKWEMTNTVWMDLSDRYLKRGKYKLFDYF